VELAREIDYKEPSCKKMSLYCIPVYSNALLSRAQHAWSYLVPKGVRSHWAALIKLITTDHSSSRDTYSYLHVLGIVGRPAYISSATVCWPCFVIYGAFQRAIRVEWAAIDQDLIDGLIRSMDNRVNTVLEANGWHTRYWHLVFLYNYQTRQWLRLQCFDRS